MRQFLSFAEAVSSPSNVDDAPPRISVCTVSEKESKRTAATGGIIPARRCIAKVCSSLPCPSLPKPSPSARGSHTRTTCRPLLLVLASQVPNSALKSTADSLAVASTAWSAVVDVQLGRIDAPFDFRPTLATCRYSTVPATAAGMPRLCVACACQTCVWARPCAQASALHVRRAARRRRLSSRPRSRALTSCKHALGCRRSVAGGDRLERWWCRCSCGQPLLGCAVVLCVAALSREV